MAATGMLVVVKGYNKGDVYKLGARNLTAGRDTGNLIQLIDREVSRRHCLIRKEGDSYRIVDMNRAPASKLFQHHKQHVPCQQDILIKSFQ